MTSTVMVAVYSMCGVMAAALCGMVGVLVGAKWQYKLGMVKIDKDAAASAVTQDQGRIAQLDKENLELRDSNAKLRGEINEVWDAIKELRRDTEAEIKSLRTECKRLGDQAGLVPKLEADLRDRDAAIAKLMQSLQERDETILQKNERISSLEDMLTTTAAGQQMAESMLKQTEKHTERILNSLLPPPQETTVSDQSN